MLVLPQRKPQTQEEVVVGTSALSNYDLWQRSFFLERKKICTRCSLEGSGLFRYALSLCSKTKPIMNPLGTFWAQTFLWLLLHLLKQWLSIWVASRRFGLPLTTLKNYFIPVKFFPTLELEGWFNPLRPNISMHILYTVLYTFPKVLTRRICLLIKRLLPWWPFPLFSWP